MIRFFLSLSLSLFLPANVTVAAGIASMLTIENFI